MHKKNFLTKSLSNTLDRIGVTEIGLKSPRSRGVLTFGMGVTILCFQDVGQVDSAKIKLNIFVTMGVISNAHSLKNQYGSGSEPWDVRVTRFSAR
mgnify:CR=1 FL=1